MRHFRCHTGCYPNDGLRQQAFQIPPCILDLVKGAFTAFAHPPEEAIKGRRMLGLIGPFGCPNPAAFDRLLGRVRERSEGTFNEIQIQGGIWNAC